MASLKDWVSKHKGITIGIAFVLVIIIYFIYKYRSSSSGSTSTSTGTSSTPVTTPSSAIPDQYDGGGGEYYGGYSGIGSNNYGQIQAQLASLSTAISNLSSSSTGATAATPTGTGTGNTTYTYPTGETLSGGGYYVPGSTAPIEGSSGEEYTWISPPQLVSAQASNTPVYVQVTPGNFQPYNKSVPYPSGTPLFVQSG